MPSRGRRAFRRSRRLSESLLLTTEIASFTTHRANDALDVFVKLQRAARLARTWGDGYGYLMVATGRAEVMIDPVVNLWDAAPLQTIIEEAGGHFTDWNGNANDPLRRGDRHQRPRDATKCWHLHAIVSCPEWLGQKLQPMPEIVAGYLPVVEVRKSAILTDSLRRKSKDRFVDMR